LSFSTADFIFTFPRKVFFCIFNSFSNFYSSVDAVIVDKKTFVRSCQAFRPKQFFKDFTNADINYNNTYLKEKITNGCISILGKDAIKYHNYIGIRFDEKHRAIKIRKRIKDAKTNLSRKSKNKISSAKTQAFVKSLKNCLGLKA
jgi:hypothetical protein